MHTWRVLRIRTVSNADGLYRAYDPSTAGSATVRQYWTWLYGLKAKIYIYKEVPDLTLLVNREAKKFRLTKTKFLSHRHEISSYITNFRFDSSPRLRNIRRHFRTINAPKFRSFFVWSEGLHFFWSKFANFAVIAEVRLTPRICTALSLRILRSRRLEVVGKRKNVRARRRHARGEGAPARKAPENRFPPPLQLPGSRCVICQKFWQKTTDLAQTKRAAKKRCTFYLRSKYICYKDQLGSLIIERCSNKLMVNRQL